MSAQTTHNSKATNTAGVPPAPPEAHQRAGVLGQKRSVVMNGSRLDMEHDGKQWWIVKVSPAPFVRSTDR